jgi:hypothetical protein
VGNFGVLYNAGSLSAYALLVSQRVSSLEAVSWLVDWFVN